MYELHIQNLSNCCRHKYDKSTSQIFRLLSGGFFGIWPNFAVAATAAAFSALGSCAEVAWPSCYWLQDGTHCKLLNTQCAIVFLYVVSLVLTVIISMVFDQKFIYVDTKYCFSRNRLF